MNDFIDAQAMHQKHPDTFWAPPSEALALITFGTWLKIGIMFDDEEMGNVSAERFWARVTEINGNKIKAAVDNDLVCLPLEVGEILEFESRHVLDILKA